MIAFPTDTLYALAADAMNRAAVQRVFEIKGREEGNPLPLFVTDSAMAARFAIMSESGLRLTRRFWPGALTVVVRRRPDFDSAALAGGDTAALRAPDHALALEIVAALGRPVTGTSANVSGGPNPVTADDVRGQLGARVDLVIDGGACPAAVPSTIVDCAGAEPVVLREGAISREEIERVLR